ncbi:MAG: hypothetical protein ACYC0H_14510 [Solirubrobacteraceae bacterium]
MPDEEPGDVAVADALALAAGLLTLPAAVLELPLVPQAATPTPITSAETAVGIDLIPSALAAGEIGKPPGCASVSRLTPPWETCLEV